MPAKIIMVQGTASNVGKSLIVAGLCRLFKNKGFDVAPFKAQNMSNNSFATLDGGEIGRAQSVQAEACGIRPTVHMNPILLKTMTDRKSQVIVLGKPAGNMKAVEYEKNKGRFARVVKKSLQTLTRSHDIVVIEGAGSPAEINLKMRDIVNMSVAKMASSPVILVGDIDRGGVFAQLVGTYDLLDEDEKKLIKGFLINKFRGDKRIFMPGIKWIEKRTGKKILGVVPYIQDHAIPEEDAFFLQEDAKRNQPDLKRLLVQVVRLPSISNFNDFEPLGREGDVMLEYVHRPDRHRLPDLFIIPGSKSTVADLKFLRRSGFADFIRRCVSARVPVLGICGGYQMLGNRILDPERVESDKSHLEGLGLLPMTTVFNRKKVVSQVKAVHIESGSHVKGYEIHMGRHRGQNGNTPLFRIIERHGKPVNDYDGQVLNLGKSPDRSGFIMGTYIHGLFDQPGFRHFFLNRIRRHSGLAPLSYGKKNHAGRSADKYDKLAKILEDNLDMKELKKILGLSW